MSLQAAAGRFLPYIIKGYYQRTVPYRRRAFLSPNTLENRPVHQKPFFCTEFLFGTGEAFFCTECL